MGSRSNFPVKSIFHIQPLQSRICDALPTAESQRVLSKARASWRTEGMERKDNSFSSGEGTTYAQAVVATSTGAIARDGTRERAKLGRSSWETWVNHEARVTRGTIL